MRVFCAVLFFVFVAPIAEVSAVSRSNALPVLQALEAASLKSIAAWLKESGRDGYLAADVVEAAGIPRDKAEGVLDAKQRGFKTGGVLHIAQIPADSKRDFLLFMVQRPDGEMYFYLSTVREGLKKAFVLVPFRKTVQVLDPAEAQENFRQEVFFWGQRVAGDG